MTANRERPDWVDSARARARPQELPLWQALEEVTDPEYPVSVLDMGLIYGLRKEAGTVTVQLTFTSMGCPCMEFIIADIRERLLLEDGVQAVAVEIVWDPPWTRKRLSPRAIEKLRTWGVSA